MSARRLLRTFGFLISMAALIWIAAQFVQRGALDLLRSVPLSATHLAGVLLAGALAYALAMCLPGLAWWRLTVALAERRPPARAMLATYAVTQYGKYLPGNVAHYALRHAWSRRYGLSHGALGLASILEAALLLLAALSLTLLADARELRFLSMIDPRAAIALVIVLLIGLGIALHFARRRTSFGRLHLPVLPPTSTLLACLACYAAFFILCAAILDALARALAIPVDSFAMLLAASAASWLAGFIVVGAPGGLGVREAAFVALAGAALREDRALLLIGLFRAVTFLGDTLFLAAGAIAARAADRSAAAVGTEPPSERESSS